MKLKGIDHINLDVKNLEDSVRFYSDLFGFEKKESGRTPKGLPWTIIGVAGVAYLALYETGQEAQYDGLNHLGFNVENLEDFIKKTKSLGVSIELDYEYPNSRSIYINDPNQIEIEVSSTFGGGLD